MALLSLLLLGAVQTAVILPSSHDTATIELIESYNVLLYTVNKTPMPPLVPAERGEYVCYLHSALP